MSGDLRTARYAAILLGIGLGGFADGIVLHQILQWHNMLSSRIPPTDMDAMRVNMTADGLFHLAMWAVTLAGVYLLARGSRGTTLSRHGWLTGWLLFGWGSFNLVEGVIDHQLLGLHHVRYDPMRNFESPSLPWDLGFLAIGGVALILIGTLVARRASRGFGS